MSPSNSAIAEVESIFCIEKDTEFLAKPNFQSTASAIKRETGLDILGDQIGRYENIELLNFPSGNIYNRSYVTIVTVKSESKINNSLTCKAFKVQITNETKGTYLINAKATNGFAIVLDQVKSVEINQTCEEIIFTATEEISNIHVKVWKESNGDLRLWHEKKYNLIRELVTMMSVNHGHGSIESKNLNEQKKIKSLIPRVNDIQKIILAGHRMKSIIGGCKDDPWKHVIEGINQIYRRSFPLKSRAKFFARGWEGQLSFYEWLKDISKSNIDFSKIVIIDPYLEDETIRFIPRFERSDVHFILVANTLISENKIVRKNGIIDSANSIFGKLNNYQVEIYDVISDEKLIHDRYILLGDKYGGFLNGYHLSNSIQKANRNYPLLITEIPTDVCMEIQEWLSNILKDKLELIWNGVKDDICTHTPLILEKEYLSIDEEKIREMLLSSECYDNWKYITANAFNNNNTVENLDVVAKNLNIACWEILSRGVLSELLNIESIGKERIEDDITDFIVEHDFSHVLDYGNRIFKYSHHVYGVSPSEYYFVDLSIRFSSENIISHIHEYQKTNLVKLDKYKVVTNKHYLQVIDSLRMAFLFRNLDERIFVKSSILWLISIAVASISEKMLDEKITTIEALNRISCLEFERKFKVIINWIYHLRIRQNQCRPNGDSKKYDEMRVELFKALMEIWTEEHNDVTVIENIIVCCGGPGNGSWACSTANELLIPLIDKGSLSVEIVSHAIKNLFDKHMTKGEHFDDSSSLNVLDLYSYMVSRTSNINAIDSLQNEAEKNIRIILKPFASTASYRDYSDSIDYLHKIIITCSLVQLYTENWNYLINTVVGKINDALNKVGKLFDTSNSQLNEISSKVLEMAKTKVG